MCAGRVSRENARGKRTPTPVLKLPELAGVVAFLAIMLWLTARNTGLIPATWTGPSAGYIR